MSHELENALKRVQPRWSEARASATQHGMERKRRRRRAVRVAAVLMLAGLVGAGAWRWTRPELVTPPPERIATVPTPAPSLAFQVENVAVAGIAPSFEEGALARGKVRLRGNGVLRAGEIEVSVFQALVLVERIDGSTTVWVEEGEAVISWKGEERRLERGQTATFPPPIAQADSPEPGADVPVVAPTKKDAARKKWRQLAEQGDFDAAYVEMRERKLVPRDEPEELLLAADVARLSRHPADAVAPLQQVLARHPKDPRAPLAAFTLGRTLLDELGRPTDAAEAFRQARALAPKGTLAGDALAREVEAQARAGHTAEARKLAEEYLQRWPEGPRARLVRHHGGLE